MDDGIGTGGLGVHEDEFRGEELDGCHRAGYGAAKSHRERTEPIMLMITLLALLQASDLACLLLRGSLGLRGCCDVVLVPRVTISKLLKLFMMKSKAFGRR